MLLVTACEKDESPLIEQAKEAAPLEPAPDPMLFAGVDNPTILGEQEINPYSLRVVRKAAQNLTGSKKGANLIQPTHLYIRFEPKDLDDVQKLSLDTSIVLFDVPLDYEILEPGSGYRDPSVPAGQPNYAWTAVPVDYGLDGVGVQYSVLDSLYQPDGYNDDEGNRFGRPIIGQYTLANLEDEALVTAGHITKKELNERSAKRARYRPSVHITFRDDDGTRPGLPGARITMRRWSKYGEGFTDEFGRATCDKRFRYDVNFQLLWERYEFAIKDSWMTRAKIERSGRHKRWVHLIDNRSNQNDRDWRRAMVHRGAHQYYYENINGLQRPPQNGVFRFQLHYRVRDTPVPGVANHDASRQWLGFGSQIELGIYPPAFRDAATQVAIAVHETAHATHWNQDRDAFDDREISIKLIESYAIGVEHFVTWNMYPNYTRSPLALGRGRTEVSHGIAVDLFDRNDGSTTIDGACCEDQVESYTFAQIEESVFDATDLDQWEDFLQLRYPNRSGRWIDELFDYWD